MRIRSERGDWRLWPGWVWLVVTLVALMFLTVVGVVHWG